MTLWLLPLFLAASILLQRASGRAAAWLATRLGCHEPVYTPRTAAEPSTPAGGLVAKASRADK